MISKNCIFGFLLTVFFLCNAFGRLFAQESCTNNRYLSQNFTVTRTDNIPYGNAPALIYPPYVSETSTYNKQLVLDLYLPDTDTLTKRPAIVMAFGGAFLLGWKQQPQLVDFCNALASRGYVVASIDYRLGFNPANTNTAIRAVYRAAQDLKAAIRFLKLNAATYGIDTNYVYAGGNSAGGVSALHAAYVSEAERAASPLMAVTYTGGLFNSWPNLGCVECSGNNLGQPPYNISGTPDLVINLWGAIADLNFIQSPSDAPVISFHGQNDNIVLPDVGAPFSYPLFPALYGSIAIADRCNDVGIMNELHLFDAGHEVWIDPDAALYIQEHTATFLYEYLKPATPVISGPATVCAGSTANYSVPAAANHTFCWSVQGGTILTNPANTNTIAVQWGAEPGTITVRKINRNLYESDAATLNVNMTTPTVPQNLLVINTSYLQTQLVWLPIAGVNFEVSYRPLGETTWNILTATNSNTTLSNLLACTRYELRVRSYCGEAYSAYALTSFTTDCLRAKVKVWLEGAYNATAATMNTALLAAGQIPLQQPFNQPPWNYAGFEQATTLPDNTVDWVLIELRSATNYNLITDRSAGLLLANGTVVAPEGEEGVVLRNTTNTGNYYLVVRHRNHAPVMSAVPTTLPNNFAYDFTVSPVQVYGSSQEIQLGINTYALYAGDYEQNAVITHTDFIRWQLETNNPTPYNPADGNLDGVVNTADFTLSNKNAGIIGVPVVRY